MARVSHQYNVNKKRKRKKRTIHDNQGKKISTKTKNIKEIKKYTCTKVLDIVGNAAQKIALKR